MTHQRRFADFMALSCWLGALVLGPACAHAPAPAPTTTIAAESASTPDAAKTRRHMQEHVQYPASRAQILAACAQTREFTAQEKQWLSDRLPEGSYASADQVIEALRM